MTDYENPWIYEGEAFTADDIGDNYGFVYLITHRPTNKMYVGKKLFWAKKSRQVKGKKKRYKADSDWRTYYGSSEELKMEIEKHGADQFDRRILHLCKSKGECNYWEAYEQFVRHVLLSDEYYNSWIQVKVHRSHVNKAKKEGAGSPE